MKTECTLLPVYNKLYNLDLTEAELEKIETKVKKLSEANFKYCFVTNNDVFVTLSGDGSYYNRNSVELFKINDEKDRENLKSKLPYYMPNFWRYNPDEFKFKDIEILKLNKKDLEGLLNSSYYIHNTFKSSTREDIYIHSIEQMKLLMREKLLNTIFDIEHIFRNSNSDNLSNLQETINWLGWIFDINTSTPALKQNIRDKKEFIYQFIDIFEGNNIRIGVASAKYESRWGGYQESTAIMIANSDKSCYDYMDVGRQFYFNSRNLKDSHNNYSNADMSDLPKVFLLNDKVQAPQTEEVFVDILNRNPGKPTILADSVMIEAIVKRFQRRDAIKKQKATLDSKLKDKFNDKLIKLKGTDDSINMNGVKIKEHSIEYEGQLLESQDVDMIQLIRRYSYYRDIEELNFDTLSEDFYNSLNNKFEYLREDSTLSGKIGDIDFSIENKTSTSVNGNLTRVIYINGFRVKKDEIGDIIKRGLCFGNQETFNSFVSQVSKCSLLLHKYLNEGILLDVYDDFKGKRIHFKLPIVRRSGKNFIKIGENEYGVSDTNKLIKLSEKSGMHDIINTLLDPKVVKISGPSDIAHIIKKGEELHEEDKNKNKDMIERVENLFGIEVTNITMGGERARGYIINGKMSKYFLDIGQTDKQTVFDRLRVFSYPDLQYVCMIDKSVQQTGPSSLINRIYALHNDALIAKDVDTLQKVNQA